MRYFLEVDAPQRVPQRFALPESVVQLGSGAESELQFDGLPDALLSIEARDDGAFVRLLVSQEHSLVTNGTTTHEALATWGSDAFVDGMRLSFIAEAEPKRGTSPVLLLALVTAVAWLGWQGADAKAEQPTEAMDAIALKAPSVSCPETSADGARTAAKRAEQAAVARQQRYSFDASEGLKAAGSFRLAEACFGVAGDAAAHARVSAQREAVERSLAADEVSLRLHLDLTLTQQRWQDARITVRKLDELVAPLGATPYRGWLRSTLRWIDARSSGR